MEKLGDVSEAANIILNKCNALYLSGDIRSALETAREMYDRIPNDASVMLRNIKISLLSNIGHYQLDLKDYNTAETSLQQAISACEEIGLESTLRNSLSSLAELYTQTDRYIQAVEIYQRWMELRWLRREYGMLTHLLRQAVYLLLSRHYFAAAEELWERWKTKFDQIPGGSEFFKQEMHTATLVDEQEIDQLKEQLVLAKSEKDVLRSARLCSRLADVLGQVDREQSIIYLLEAAESYRQIGDDAQTMDHLYKVAAGLFEKGKVRNKALLSQLMSSISDPSALRVIQLWEQFGSDATPRSVQKKARPFNRLWKIFSPEPKSLSDKTPSEEIASYANICEELVTYCLLDLTEQIIKVCSAKQIIGMIRDLPKKASQTLRQHLGSVMLKNAADGSP